MIGAVNAQPRPWARTSTSCCRECTASRPWPNGGCFPPTKARCTSSTCLVTWTSSASGSTVAAHAAAVWSSTGCTNWPSATTQSVTSSSLRAPSRRRSGRPLPETEATRLAWTAPAPDDPGVIRPDEAKSAQMDSPVGAYVGLVPTESSSGGSRSQGGVTKTGNGHVRRLLIEAAWHHRQPYRTPGATMRRRWELASPAAQARGHAGNRRLHDRWMGCNARKKRSVVANAAIARELAGWCWSLAVLDEPAQ